MFPLKSNWQIHSIMIFLYIFLAAVFLSQSIYASPFQVDKSLKTHAEWRGRTLIESDHINYGGPDVFENRGHLTRDRKDGWKVLNVTSDAEDLPFRKETGLRDDRIELTVQYEIPAYSQQEDKERVFYQFSVPIETLENMEWKAIAGRTNKPEEVSGKITRDAPDGDLALCRWIAFSGGERNIVFDLDPKGMPSFHDYGPGDIISRWTVSKQGEFITFRFGYRSTVYGGVFTGKVVIFEGTFDDYLNRHAQDSYGYFSELPTEKRFSFGSPNPVEAYQKADASEFDPEAGFGWEGAENLQLQQSGSASVHLNSVVSNEAGTFKCQIERPGLYIITLRSASKDKPQGPFSVVSNEEKKASGVTISENKIKQITFSQWLEVGPYEIDFKGDWALSNLSLQMLLHQEEDFAFHRGVWLIDNVYEPTPINSNECCREEPDYAVYITDIDIPEGELEPEEIPSLPPGEIIKPSSTDPDLSWRYGAYIAGFGPSNFGTFLEFDTEELIRKRLGELKAGNVNVVILNGLLARHCFKLQLPRVKKTIQLITRIAHEMDMRIIDHQDLTLMWNKQTATRTLVEEIHKCQYTIKDGLPNRGLCLSNPDMVDDHLDWLMDFIVTTGIDGLMMDEACFHGVNFCGCSYCREQFHEDTGLHLPVDENSPLLNNRDSLLWKTWILWRQHQVADWFIQMRKRIMLHKPDFSIMKYTTAYGIENRWAPYSFGGDLFKTARAADFLGTEIMSRNVMASYREVFANRKIFNNFRLDYDSPVFGLVYNIQSKDFAYFGWAMNTMHGQSTWDFGYEYAPKAAIQFDQNMDSRLSEPVADIALIFSSSSRNWPKFSGSISEMKGISQILTDHQVQHVILSERSLRWDRLNDYRLVILPGQCCMSDYEIDQVKQYLLNGGRVLITGHSGLMNEVGISRDSWPFEDVFGAAIQPNFSHYKPEVGLALQMEDMEVAYPNHVLRVTVSDGDKHSVFLSVNDSEGKALSPAGLAAKYGQGEAFYVAPFLGHANYEHFSMVGRKWEYTKNQELAELLMRVIHKAAGGTPLRFEAVEMPEKLLTTVYRQHKDGQLQTLVHLLNGTGIPTLEPGQEVPGKSPTPAFPPLEEDLVFEITLENLISGFCVSPDYKEVKEISIEPLGEFRYRVTVPKDGLETYSLVYLLENEVE